MKAISAVLKKANVVNTVGKIAIFEPLKRNGKVYIVVAPNAQSAALLPIIREKVKPDSIVYTDTFRSYDVPVNLAIFTSITARILLKIIPT